MKNGLRALILIWSLFLLAACSSRAPVRDVDPVSGRQPVAVTDEIRVGTWNLEWFGALNRTEENIRSIADIIREMEIDVLVMQEIVCECSLQDLSSQLGYSYFLSPQRIPQKLAVMWNQRRVDSMKFDREAYDDLYRVAHTGLSSELRQPLVFRIVAGQFDFTLMVVHLKSIPEAERSVSIRNVQYDAINEWLVTELNRSDAETDIIIAGDFNSFHTGVSSQRLLEAGHMKFLTPSLPGGTYSNIWYNRDGERSFSLIDHIAITPTLELEEFVKLLPVGNWDVEMGGENYENSISDHLPLVAVFRTTEDED